VRLGRKYGVGALAALAGIGAGVGAFRNLTREVEGKLAEDAFLEFRNAQRRQVIDQEADRARRESLQAAIDLNLQRVAQADPAMYAQVMAGRRLPQGAVVLGGEQRTDLLQELGRAMAEGRFTQ
jgi:Sec-independent protein translocase protein TatA